MKSELNISFIRVNLQYYNDSVICDYLELRWPINFEGEITNKCCIKNYKGDLQFPNFVGSYLKNEIKYNAVLGAFKTNLYIQKL